jgi:uncharacterized membrane protein YfbV (UPF0208 family)
MARKLMKCMVKEMKIKLVWCRFVPSVFYVHQVARWKLVEIKPAIVPMHAFAHKQPHTGMPWLGHRMLSAAPVLFVFVFRPCPYL